MKHNIRNVILTILSGIMVVFILYLLSVQKVLFSKNNFKRNLLFQNIQLLNKFSLNFNASEIIKVSDSNIFIVNSDRRDIYLYDFKISKSLNYTPFLSQVKIPLLHRTYIDQDTLIVVSPRNRKIYRTRLVDTSDYKSYDSISIKDGVETLGYSKSSYFIVGRDSLRNAAYLTLKKSSNNLLKLKKNGMIENTREGIIADDGFFINESNRTIYSKYHKNELYLINENGRECIKTMTIAKKKVSPRINKSKNGTVTIMGEIHFKSLRGSIDGTRLYLQSGVKADNENPFRFKFNSIIDTYGINNNDLVYKNSFYIPSFSGVKCNDFLIKNNTLYALYGNYLLTYKIKNEID